jgi:hypothetical protein
VLTVRWVSSPRGWPSLSQDILGGGVPSVKHVIEVELPLTIVISSVPIALSISGGTGNETGKIYIAIVI